MADEPSSLLAGSSPGARPFDTNPGAPLDLDWVQAARIDEREVQRRAQKLADTASRDSASERGRLLAAVRCLDLTTLAGDDTAERVAGLCAMAADPLGEKLRSSLGAQAGGSHVAAVCVYPVFVRGCLRALDGTNVKVCSVAGGFPHGQLPTRLKVAEVEAAVAEGANEVDAVMRRSHALTDDWQGLYDEVRALREACRSRTLKVILGTGELGGARRVALASRVCLLAGADFIKTSTGTEAVNATLPNGLIMAAAIRDYESLSGYRAGLKPAGGIKTAPQVVEWASLIHQELGAESLHPGAFRIGASGVLENVTRRLRELAD